MILWWTGWLLGCGAPDAPRPGPACDADEVCNGVDDDCDGLIDDDDPGLVAPRFVDGDGDGYGGAAIHQCDPADTVDIGGDCDDTDPTKNPGQPERCGNGDDDCDGWIDGADADLIDRRAPDLDGDGHGDATLGRLGCPGVGEGLADDCDDTDPAVYPGAPEVCDGHPDNDCDGIDDLGELDEDGDGDGICSDCDDSDPLRSSRFEERCDGIDTDCDGLVDADDDSVNPYTCGSHCPVDDVDAVAAAPLVRFTLNPCLLDDEAVGLCEPTDTHTEGKRLHGMMFRADAPLRDELMLFLPPGPGGYNYRVRQWAAYVGYRTISLGFVNDEDIAAYCAPAADACYFDFRYEMSYGVDTSPVIEVGPADGLVRRLEVLLDHLVTVRPDEGWGRYLDADGGVAWEHIVVSGWSIGAGQAAFLAKYHPVKGVVLLSGPKDRINDPDAVPSSWLRSPSVTEPCRHYGVFHVDEPLVPPPEDLIRQAWAELGLPFPEVDLFTGLPTDQTFSTDYAFDEEVCKAHQIPGHDACLPDAFYEPYAAIYCAAAEASACDAGDR